MPSTSHLACAARDYLAAGLCVLPSLRREKRPATHEWSVYRQRLPSVEELQSWFARDPEAICIVCGAISGHAEMIDFDAGGELFDPWARRIPADLLGRLVIETTQRGGRHVFYRSSVQVGGNMKLAQRLSPEGKVLTLIETRGEGGLFLCSPTEGYEMIQGDFRAPPVLTENERDVLLSAAWELNEYLPLPVNAAHEPNSFDSLDDRPGDDYNRRGDVRTLLSQAGWSCVRHGSNEYWRRPGKTSGWSATLKDRVFYVFSSNAAPFEPNRAYSPFAAYTLLCHAGDYRAAALALRASGYGHPRSDESDESEAMLSTPPERAPTTEDPGLIPLELLRVPGFVNEVIDYCLESAPYPNPVMAFAGALSLQAFLAGRKVRDPGDNRTNIYLLGLAHSSAGKDEPRKINTRILHEIGMADSLGGRFASGEGIQDALFLNPCMLFQTDEIDGILQSINKIRDGRHEAIMSTLLTMYSAASSVYPMRRKAGVEYPGVIHQPCLVIFGTATPRHYYDAISDRMLTNGFFARMLILESYPRGPGQEPKIRDLPPRILETARWWAHFVPTGGNLAGCHPQPRTVDQTEDAQRLLIDTRLAAESEYSRAESQNDEVGTTVWGRVSEQVRKLALLYAISENHSAPLIDADAVRWASAFVMHQTRRMLWMAATHVAENDFDALLKRAIRYLRDWHARFGATALMPANELRRRLKQRPRDFTDIVTELTERGIAIFEKQEGKTKPKTGFRLL